MPTKTFSTIGGVIEINILGLKNDAKRKKQVVDAGLPAMTAYGPCVRVGEFLLPSGLMALTSEGIIAVPGHRVALAHSRTAEPYKRSAFTAMLKPCARLPRLQ